MTDANMVFAAYKERMGRQKLSATAEREFRLVTTAFLAFMQAEGLEMEDVRGDDVEKFMAESGWAPATQRARITYLRSTWKYAVNRLDIPLRDPFYDLRLTKVPVREPKIVSNADLRRVKAGIKTRQNMVLFCLLAYQGMRSIEIRRLQWNGVSFAEQTLNFIGKGDRERTIPMHPQTQEALKELGVFAGGSPYVIAGQTGGELTQTGIWHKTVKMSGAVEASPHDYRRSWATSLEHNEARQAAILQMGWGARHSGDIRLDHYTALPQRILMRELLKVYADDPV